MDTDQMQKDYNDIQDKTNIEFLSSAGMSTEDKRIARGILGTVNSVNTEEDDKNAKNIISRKPYKYPSGVVGYNQVGLVQQSNASFAKEASKYDTQFSQDGKEDKKTDGKNFHQNSIRHRAGGVFDDEIIMENDYGDKFDQIIEDAWAPL